MPEQLDLLSPSSKEEELISERVKKLKKDNEKLKKEELLNSQEGNPKQEY